MYKEFKCLNQHVDCVILTGSRLYVGCVEVVESALTVSWRKVEGETADIFSAVPGTP